MRTSSNGNGWGFIDQQGRLVLVIANIVRGDSAVQIDLTGLVDGSYAPIDGLADSVATNVTVSGGRARFTLNLGDYDTRLLVFPAGAVINN